MQKQPEAGAPDTEGEEEGEGTLAADAEWAPAPVSAEVVVGPLVTEVRQKFAEGAELTVRYARRRPLPRELSFCLSRRCASCSLC